MSQIKKIIGIGSPIVDAIARVEDAFLNGIEGAKGGMELTDSKGIVNLLDRLETLHEESPGGSAGNTLFALARMGLPTGFLGKIGNDSSGDYYQNCFAELGGDCSHFRIGNVPSGRCVSLVTPDGERTMRTDLGAAMTLSPEEITLSDFQHCKHAHIEGYLLFNRDLMMHILSHAKEANCTISLDLASFEVVEASRDILPQILHEYVDIIFANEEEGEAFTGIKDDHEAAAKELSKYSDIAAVKVGSKGSIIAHNNKIVKVDSISVENVVDTTGAGDLWAAGFLYGWFNKLEIAQCAQFGSILGAEVVQKLGSTLPDQVWEDILNRIKT